MNDWVEYEVYKGQDFNAERREYFEKGFDRALKVLHAWACGKYNDHEETFNMADVPDLGELRYQSGAMSAFQEMKREIMSMYKEEKK